MLSVLLLFWPIWLSSITIITSITKTNIIIISDTILTKVITPTVIIIPLDAFNRTIKLYQAISKSNDILTEKEKSTPKDEKKGISKGGMSARDVLKNPPLARLLVLAAKKVKAYREEKEGDKGKEIGNRE